jgi:hypothetical protein
MHWQDLGYGLSLDLPATNLHEFPNMPHNACLTLPINNLQKFSLLLILLVIPLSIRAFFDPSRTAVELPYPQYRMMLSTPEGQKRIERINLQLGLTDFWGRDIATLKLRGENCMRFMVVTPGFYHLSYKELRPTHIEAHNLCMDCTPVIEVLLAAVLCSFVLCACARRQS